MSNIINYNPRCTHQRTVVDLVKRVNDAVGFEKFVITRFVTYEGLRPHETGLQLLKRDTADSDALPYLHGMGGINCYSMTMFFNGALSVLA